MPTANYAVTFEFEMRKPVTHRGTVDTGGKRLNVASAARAAVKQAKAILRPRNWTSCVCLVENPQVLGSDEEGSAPPEATHE